MRLSLLASAVLCVSSLAAHAAPIMPVTETINVYGTNTGGQFADAVYDVTFDPTLAYGYTSSGITLDVAVTNVSGFLDLLYEPLMFKYDPAGGGQLVLVGEGNEGGYEISIDSIKHEVLSLKFLNCPNFT